MITRTTFKHCVCSILMYHYWYWRFSLLAHWGRVTHICVGNLTTIGSINGLSPCRHQAIILTNVGILHRNFNPNANVFHSRKHIWKCSRRNGCNFVSASICKMNIFYWLCYGQHIEGVARDHKSGFYKIWKPRWRNTIMEIINKGCLFCALVGMFI